MPGYNPRFFSGLRLPLPKLTAAQKKLRASLLAKPKSYELKYTHFSVVQNKKRGFAFYTATNINGNSWKILVKKEADFKKEADIASNHQTGNELYEFHQSLTKNDFDKGHITKLQDPQWGDEQTIRQAAADTMKFVNCLPQHQKLNRGAWKSLEDYIVKKFTRKTGIDGRKVTVFAGPLLLPNDPYYIDKINGKSLQIPCYFWKVIVYPNRQNILSAVGFLMSQRNLLFKSGFVTAKQEGVRKGLRVERDFFSDFKSGEPYQVNISFLEQATGFSFGVNSLHQPYTKTDPAEVIFERVEAPLKTAWFRSANFADQPLGFILKGIRL